MKNRSCKVQDMWPANRSISRRSLIGAVGASMCLSMVPALTSRSEAVQADGAWTDLMAMTPFPSAWTNDEPVELFTTADVAMQLETLGLPAPTSTDDPDFRSWIAATYTLGLPTAVANLALDPDFERLLGWNVTQIDQSLESLVLPEGLVLLRGRFDHSTVEQAWSEQGYKGVAIGEFKIAQLSPEPGFDLTSDMGQFGLGRFNNAVFLDDRTLAYTTSQHVMEAVIGVADGTVPSILEHDSVADVVFAVPKSLVATSLVGSSALGFEGGSKRGIGRDSIPQFDLVMFGHTAGLPLVGPGAEETTIDVDAPDSTVMISMDFDSESDAELALERASDQLGTKSSVFTERPYSDFFASWDGFVVAETSTAVLELVPTESPGIWRQLLYRRDLGFLT